MLELHKLVKRVNNHFDIRELLKLSYRNDALAYRMLPWLKKAKFISYECDEPAEVMEAFPLWPDSPAKKAILRKGKIVNTVRPKAINGRFNNFRVIRGVRQTGWTDKMWTNKDGKQIVKSLVHYRLKGNTLTITNKLTNQVIVVTRVV